MLQEVSTAWVKWHYSTKNCAVIRNNAGAVAFLLFTNPVACKHVVFFINNILYKRKYYATVSGRSVFA